MENGLSMPFPVHSPATEKGASYPTAFEIPECLLRRSLMMLTGCSTASPKADIRIGSAAT